MNKNMEKYYKISRVILVIATLIISEIMFINEDESWRIIPFIFSAIVLGFSFPSSIISKKLINFEKKLEKNILKILYYVVVLPVIALLFFYVLYLIMFFIFERIQISNEIGLALEQSFVFLFLIAVIFIAIILPYIQTLIVLLINRLLGKEGKVLTMKDS